ncbi:MAG: alpha/beta fold hydrolase [Solirubrobacteraceae bacterium]
MSRKGPLLALDVAGSGKPLVLLHGLATDRRIWHAVVPALARERRVVSVDLPGFGASAPAGKAFDLDEVAERIVRGLAARRIPSPFDLVGHSLGAGVATALAAQHPGAIDRLVLVAPAGFNAMPGAVSALLAAGVDGALAAHRWLAPLTELAWGRRLLLGYTVADGASIPATVARQMVNASGSAQRSAPALATITTSDLRPRLRDLRAPLGLIWGEKDRTVPVSQAGALTTVRPDAQVVLLPDAGHVPMVECPDAFVAALATLLSSLPVLDRSPVAARGLPTAPRGG